MYISICNYVSAGSCDAMNAYNIIHSSFKFNLNIHLLNKPHPHNIK